MILSSFAYILLSPTLHQVPFLSCIGFVYKAHIIVPKSCLPYLSLFYKRLRKILLAIFATFLQKTFKENGSVYNLQPGCFSYSLQLFHCLSLPTWSSAHICSLWIISTSCHLNPLILRKRLLGFLRQFFFGTSLPLRSPAHISLLEEWQPGQIPVLGSEPHISLSFLDFILCDGFFLFNFARRIFLHLTHCLYLPPGSPQAHTSSLQEKTIWTNLCC